VSEVPFFPTGPATKRFPTWMTVTRKLEMTMRIHTLTGTFTAIASPNIGFHVAVCKIKSVLFEGSLKVLIIFNFVVPEIFQNLFCDCYYEKAC
jgi:hypothetical protein